jgi:hypothetical protein
MTKQRASIFDEPTELDVSAFKPKRDSDNSAPTKAQVKAVAESKNFKSREASTPTVDAGRKTTAQRRVLRTGRSVQFNVKASQEVIDEIYAITNTHNGWVLGYTLERAVAALKRELAANPSENARSVTDANTGSQVTGQGTTTTARL